MTREAKKPWCFGWYVPKRVCNEYLYDPISSKWSPCPSLTECREETKETRRKIAEFVKASEEIIGEPLTTTAIAQAFRMTTHHVVPQLEALQREGKLSRVRTRKGRGSVWKAKRR